MRCARRGRRANRFRCAFPPTTGLATKASSRMTRSRSPPVPGGRRRYLRRIGRADLHRAQPVYGRMFQTPFSDRIRNETGMATMAVGNIFEPDHVNSILMAGRADLVCLARPHLADPYWTLHAAAKLGDRAEGWPLPYLPGRDQLYRLAGGSEQSRGKCDYGAHRQTCPRDRRRQRHRRCDRRGDGGRRRSRHHLRPASRAARSDGGGA